MPDMPTCIYEARNVCGEGPVWDVAEQALYWVDIPECKIMRYDREGQVSAWNTPSDIGAFALRRSGGVIAGLRSGMTLIDLERGHTRIVANPAGGQPNVRFNDGKCDRQGRFWCGTCHEQADLTLRQPIAALYRIDPRPKLSSCP